MAKKHMKHCKSTILQLKIKFCSGKDNIKGISRQATNGEKIFAKIFDKDCSPKYKKDA